MFNRDKKIILFRLKLELCDKHLFVVKPMLRELIFTSNKNENFHAKDTFEYSVISGGFYITGGNINRISFAFMMAYP